MDDAVNVRAVFETSWWEYVRGPDGAMVMFQIDESISGPKLRNMMTGEVRFGRDLPIGALFALDRSDCKDANGWPPAGACDGLSIACKTLGGRTWYIDSRASNCTRKDDNGHRCWVRHGTVGGRLTVDKAGSTCAAGAGSFYMGPNNEWHGFLRDGKLTPG